MPLNAVPTMPKSKKRLKTHQITAVIINKVYLKMK